ncbi:MAG: FISUMP domain-containing protein [Bacteroidales bacterium]
MNFLRTFTFIILWLLCYCASAQSTKTTKPAVKTNTVQSPKSTSGTTPPKTTLPDKGPKPIKIGPKIWTLENLNVTSFQNGDAIPEVKTAEAWKKAGENGEPAWCFYNNDPANGAKYGRLYNYHAVVDPRGLAPYGWHIPSETEWETFINYLGGNTSGGKVMSKGTTMWKSPNKYATNETGFNALPSGSRFYFGDFTGINESTGFWASTAIDRQSAFSHGLDYYFGILETSSVGKGAGKAVRLIKNDALNAGFKTMPIGDYIWMAENLKVTKFRNGDAIFNAKTEQELEDAGIAGKAAYYILRRADDVTFFYNWNAVNDPRKLAPEGWHISTPAEWTDMLSELGGAEKAGAKMRKGNFAATSPGLVQFGVLMSENLISSWWTTEEVGMEYATSAVAPFAISDEVKLNPLTKTFGLVVRCVSDSIAQLPGPRHVFGTMTDVEGTSYKTIVIGKQTWMAENLKTTKLNDGTEIKNEKDRYQWDKLSTAAYCWFKNDRDMYRKRLGALYNYQAVETGKLCPEGWHVPTKDEWTTLIEFLGPESGGKMKVAGTDYWQAPNQGATNESGFCGLPSSYLSDNFGDSGFSSYYWSSTPQDDKNAYYCILHKDYANLNLTSYHKHHGQSVRCLKD